MRLYSHPVQPNAVRVLMFMDEKGIDIPVVDLDMLAGEHKDPDYLEKNPRGQVPALELDDGTTISESLVICRYLDEVYGEPFLFGRGETERAQIALWERRAELGLFIPAIEYGHHTIPELSVFFDQHPKWAESLRSGIDDSLSMIDEQLSHHPFLSGDNFSIADITGFLGAQYVEGIVGIRFPDASPGAEWVSRIGSREGARAFHTSVKLTEEFLNALRQMQSAE